mmetsp:Transcript_3860/g.5253  ORF Transcript_3860/g.5253 Transcript_3860/m.5253 type:complete len:104 (+) Transcript_3860:114-425(+)
MKTFVCTYLISCGLFILDGFTNSYLFNNVKRSNIARSISSKFTPNCNESMILDDLEGNTLLNVDECLFAYKNANFQSRDQGGTRLVFIDASWWHKGNLNGREL